MNKQNITLRYNDNNTYIDITEKSTPHLDMGQFRDLCAKMAGAIGYSNFCIQEYFYAEDEYDEMVGRLNAKIHSLEEQLEDKHGSL